MFFLFLFSGDVAGGGVGVDVGGGVGDEASGGVGMC